jgi:hypothetical protein
MPLAAVAAEQPAGAFLPAERCHRRAGCRGERRRGGALDEAGRAEEVRIAAGHERRRGGGEHCQAAGHDRLGALAVGQGAEHRLEDHFGGVVDPEQQSQLPQRVVPAQRIPAQVGRHSMGGEGGNEPRSVDRGQLEAAGRDGLGLLTGHGCSRAW